jgi:hypothetical protein
MAIRSRGTPYNSTISAAEWVEMVTTRDALRAVRLVRWNDHRWPNSLREG